MEIRLLKANEIEVRIQSVKENGAILFLYKDARCDMRVLDETFGVGNWQRHHEVINGNLFCNVGVRFERGNGFGEWVWKQDVGTESYAEKEKGQASDSFKRACFNWGIGRELYTAPFIWISNNGDIEKGKCKSTFTVKEIGYNEQREINHLVIIDNKNRERFRIGSKVPANNPATPNKNLDQPNANESSMKCSSCGVDIDQRVSGFSKSKFGKELCRSCQNKESK